MAQPAQIFSVLGENGASGSTVANNSHEYCVIDNGTPGAAVGSGTGAPSNWTGSGFDNIAAGAVGQGQNTFGNGNIPDAVSRAKSFTCSTANVFNIVKYLNPA